jgi:eukaryotic-like serine/threonine-protein kinase
MNVSEHRLKLVEDARFVIKREIGFGAFGIVYEVFDRERAESVALKLLTNVDSASLYRFKREFRALADVIHPNLVRLYEFFAQHGQWFFTMEYVNGMDVLTHVGRGHRLPRLRPISSSDGELKETTTKFSSGKLKKAAAFSARSEGAVPELHEERLRSVLRQMVQGLLTLHRAGKVHRDVKPDNILVTKEERAVILDFGLVTEWGAERSPGTLVGKHAVGTPAYMAPEQITRGRIGPSADWYAVGVILYQALSGRLPFTGSSREIMQAKLFEDPVDPREIVPDAPEDLSLLALELLQADPDHRIDGRGLVHRLGLETSQAVRRLVARTSEPVDDGQALYGRHAELETLTKAFEQVIHGHPQLVVISGESGMGKSALVEHFANAVRFRHQACVLSGRCYEHESVPFKALDAVVDELTRHLRQLPEELASGLIPPEMFALSKLFPVLDELETIRRIHWYHQKADLSDPAELRRVAFGALRSLLIRFGLYTPTLMVVDDLQWGDPDSLRFLGSLLSLPQPPPIMLLLSYRVKEANQHGIMDLIQELIRNHTGVVSVNQLSIGRLDDAGIREIARSIIGHEETDSEEIEKVVHEAGGHAYFAQELAWMAQERASTVPYGIRTISSISETIWSRIQTLSESSRALLEVIVCARRPIHSEIALAAAGIANERELLEELRVHRLVSTRHARGEEVSEPFHDRITELVYERTAIDVLRDRHRALADELLTRAADDVEWLAQQLLASGNETAGAPFLIMAANQAMGSLAFEHAARLFEQALFLPNLTDRYDLFTQLGDAYVNAGHSLKAARAYGRAAESAKDEASLTLRRQSAEQSLRGGDMDRGLIQLRSILVSVGVQFPQSRNLGYLLLMWRRFLIILHGFRFKPTPASELSPRQLLRIDMCWALAEGLATVDTVRAVELQARHLLDVLKAGEPMRVCRALAVEAVFVGSAGIKGKERAQDLIAHAYELVREVQDPFSEGMTLLCDAIVTYNRTGWQQALALSQQGEEMLRRHCVGATYERATAHMVSLHGLCFLGRFSDVSSQHDAILQDARHRGDRYFLTRFQAEIAPYVHLCRNSSREFETNSYRLLETWGMGQFTLQHFWVHYHQVQFMLYQGEYARAWQVMKENMAALRRSRLERVFVMARSLRREQLARVYLLNSAEKPELLSKVMPLIEHLEQEQIPWIVAFGTLLRAGLCNFSGEIDQARTWYQRAALQFDEVDFRAHLSAAMIREGQLSSDEEGKKLVRDGISQLKREGVHDPTKFVALLSPTLTPRS